MVTEVGSDRGKSPTDTMLFCPLRAKRPGTDAEHISSCLVSKLPSGRQESYAAGVKTPTSETHAYHRWRPRVRHGRKKNLRYHSLSIVTGAILATWIIAYCFSDPN